ncbi:MAG TPA: SH3 domain-containing protein [Planctomycetota bacterium]|jgi:TolA protein
MSNGLKLLRYLVPVVALGALVLCMPSARAGEAASVVATGGPRAKTLPVKRTPPAPKPAAAAQPPAPRQPVSDEQAWGQVNAENVNVRNGPGTQSAILTTLHGGDFVKIKATQGTWLEIDCPEGSKSKAQAGVAYISSKYVITGVQAPTGTQAPVAAAKQATAAVPVAAASQTPAAAEKRSKTPAPTKDDLRATIEETRRELRAAAPTEDPVETARVAAEAQKKAEEQAKREADAARKQEEESARLIAEVRQKAEAEEQAKREADAKRKQDEEAGRLVAEAQKKAEAEEQAKRESDAKRKQDEETARLVAEAQKKAEAEEQAKREADAKRKQNEETARLVAEAQKKAEAEERAKREAEVRRQDEEQARLNAESTKKVVAPQPAKPAVSEERGGMFLDPASARPVPAAKVVPAEPADEFQPLPVPTRKASAPSQRTRSASIAFAPVAPLPPEDSAALVADNNTPEIAGSPSAKKARSKYILPSRAPALPGRRAEVIDGIESAPALSSQFEETPPAIPVTARQETMPAPQNKPAPAAPVIETLDLPKPTGSAPASQRLQQFFQTQVRSTDQSGAIQTAEGTLERNTITPILGADYALMRGGRTLCLLAARGSLDLERYVGRSITITGLPMQGTSSDDLVLEAGSVTVVD